MKKAIVDLIFKRDINFFLLVGLVGIAGLGIHLGWKLILFVSWGCTNSFLEGFFNTLYATEEETN